MNCTEEFIAKMKQKDIVINFVQAWRNDTLEESYARLDKPTRLHAYSVSKSVTSIGVGLARAGRAAAAGRPGAQVLSGV